MRAAILSGLVAAAALNVFLLPPVPFVRSAGLVIAAVQEEDWKKEYEDICSHTTGAMQLSADELRKLIERCDKLKPFIMAQEESTRRVYLKRLQMCRDLLQFALGEKDKGP
jgi:hypothetical protein